jgi:hypothetical protein
MILVCMPYYRTRERVDSRILISEVYVLLLSISVSIIYGLSKSLYFIIVVQYRSM